MSVVDQRKGTAGTFTHYGDATVISGDDEGIGVGKGQVVGGPEQEQTAKLIKVRDADSGSTLIFTRGEDVAARMGQFWSAVSITGGVRLKDGDWAEKVFLRLTCQPATTGGAKLAAAYKRVTGENIYLQPDLGTYLLFDGDPIYLEVDRRSMPFAFGQTTQEVVVFADRGVFQKMLIAKNWDFVVGSVVIESSNPLTQRAMQSLEALEKELREREKN